MERRIANEIMQVVNSRGLPLKLDRITPGKGNCFPIAVLDQCKRPEILSNLHPQVKEIVQYNMHTAQMQLRCAVRKFIQTSEHPNIQKYKHEYAQTVALVDDRSWEQNWAGLIQDQIWVDATFIQSTAWYLKHDIMIINTTNNDNNPVIIISGNVDNENLACSGETLPIGSKSNQHYQSLLPIEMFHLNTNPGISHKNQDTHEARHGDPLEGTSHKTPEQKVEIQIPYKNPILHPSGKSNILKKKSHQDQGNTPQQRNKNSKKEETYQLENQDFIYESNRQILVFLVLPNGKTMSNMPTRSNSYTELPE